MKHQIGHHRVEVEADTIYIVMIGDCAPEEIAAVLRIIDGMGSGKGRCYVLADVRALSKASPETRRIAGQWPGIGRIGGTAIIGANAITRALVMLVSRASIFLSRTPKIGETYFCDTEEEARRWLDTRRVPPSAPAPPSS